jgi:hypothetical protein
MFEALIPAEWSASLLAMEESRFWIFAAVVLAGAAGAFYGVFRHLHRARLIEDTPTSKVRSASQGYVELDGTAGLLKNGEILAPLTGTRCSWFEFKVEKKTQYYDSKGRQHTNWRTIESGISEELFLLVDDTGECVIDPEGAEVTPSVSEVWYGDSAQWSGGRPPSRRSRFASGDYRYTEKRILPGDPLYAIGQFRSLGGANDLPDSREAVRETINRWKQNQAVLLKHVDQDGNGEIDLQEWEQVRRAAAEVVRRQQAQQATDPVTHLLAKPEGSPRPYILSVLPQEAQARRYRRYAALFMAAFLLAGALATWMLALRLGHG